MNSTSFFTPPYSPYSFISIGWSYRMNVKSSCVSQICCRQLSKGISHVFDPRFILREQQAHGTQFSIKSLRPRQGLLWLFCNSDARRDEPRWWQINVHNRENNLSMIGCCGCAAIIDLFDLFFCFVKSNVFARNRIHSNWRELPVDWLFSLISYF